MKTHFYLYISLQESHCDSKVEKICLLYLTEFLNHGLGCTGLAQSPGVPITTEVNSLPVTEFPKTWPKASVVLWKSLTSDYKIAFGARLHLADPGVSQTQAGGAPKAVSHQGTGWSYHLNSLQ